MTRRVLGSMTGTSCDALDIAVVEVEGEGKMLTPRYVKGQTFPLGELGEQLRRCAAGESVTVELLSTLCRDFSELHVEAVRAMGDDHWDLFSVHGQTLYHAPPLSWQMIDLSWIGTRLHCPVIGDLRGADVASGGQGAPITPLADAYFYGSLTESRCVVNIGGFCNITVLPAGNEISGIEGYDLCAANQLMDLLARKVLNQPFDPSGKNALSGTPRSEWVEYWQARLQKQFRPGVSLGQKDLPDNDWCCIDGPAEDLLASACEALARCIAQALQHHKTQRVLVGGGGWCNHALRQALHRHISVPVESCDPWGPPGEFREAASLALLGVLAHDGVPITLPRVTGSPTIVRSGLLFDPHIP